MIILEMRKLNIVNVSKTYPVTHRLHKELGFKPDRLSSESWAFSPLPPDCSGCD